jgi:hypothetical protein
MAGAIAKKNYRRVSGTGQRIPTCSNACGILSGNGRVTQSSRIRLIQTRVILLRKIHRRGRYDEIIPTWRAGRLRVYTVTERQ